MEIYKYWGSGDNEPPPHLKTKKQLAEMGLKPLQPVGVIHCQSYDLHLYDPSDLTSAIPKKKRELSEAQKAALEKGRNLQKYRAWYKDIGYLIKQWILDKNSAIDWAITLAQTDNWVILDTETTGLSYAEIVQIGIINHQGDIVLDSLVKPTITIPDEVINVHGITNEMVADAPSFPEFYPQIVEALKDKKVIIYNVEFDIKILNYCCNLHNLKPLNLKYKPQCAMEEYSAFCNEWSKYYDDYISQPLNGGHTALSDCLKVLELIKLMASSTKGSFDKYKKEFGL